jgi:hypothetical protein
MGMLGVGGSFSPETEDEPQISQIDTDFEERAWGFWVGVSVRSVRFV